MIHLGDITKISGFTVPIVDCIIGGSPCQDLSVAGKRAGLEGERSGLFMEQIRIIKEMRQRDAKSGKSNIDIRPRYMVWENVPGAFSSNKGEDFRIVLEEIAKIADKDAVIPMPPKEKWTTSGCIMGDGWSIAWRVLDAQFWGVPQRRRRISLIADFGGESAPEILFVRKSLSGNINEGKPKRQEASSDASGGFGADDCNGFSWDGSQVSSGLTANNANVPLTMKCRGGCECGGKGALIQIEKSAILACNNDQTVFVPCAWDGKQVAPTLTKQNAGGNQRMPDKDNFNCVIQPVFSVENHNHDSKVGINEDGIVQTLSQRMGTGGGNVPMVMQQCFSKSKRAQTATDNETWVESDTANTLKAFDVGDVRTTEAVVYALDRASFNQGKNAKYDFEISDNGINSPLVSRGPGAVCYVVDQGGGKSACNVKEGISPTLACTHGGEAVVAMSGDVSSKLCYPVGLKGDIAGTLDASYWKGCGERNGTEREVIACPIGTKWIVRRLTPLECERLQGYPDGWTDIGDWVDFNGKKRQTSDAARYKALGNSIAIPPWKWVLKRIANFYERDATMASLFDGIGGFPYIWEQFNGKGSCLWASEIEEFPIAVTKKRIGDG